jgi:intron-binding protein aquarius
LGSFSEIISKSGIFFILIDKDVIAVKDKKAPQLIPPFVLTFPKSEFPALEDEDDEEEESSNKRKAEDSSVLVKSYRMRNLIESPKLNKIAFTQSQVEAIRSGSSKGLTLIVGPPGTGKTDVAVQIISNLYQQNPNCHMLLITRSNQALNHLFEKITCSNVDSRHLLRLGHGHEDIDSASDWGKSGRINSFLELRLSLLHQVADIAKSISLTADHAMTCETASYFFNFYLQPKWDAYQETLNNSKATIEDLSSQFPFTAYFERIRPDMFAECQSLAAAKTLASDFYLHLTGIFDKLDQVRPFELLRSNKERSNYLLVKEARIIAMTSTHASLKRRELVRLGFKYDTVIMEEAGQMLEVETFIPFLLQPHDTDLNSTPLQRIVLIGDHHQLPPIVQNQSLAKYANMDQSLFSRFIRLGIPTIELDYQGRARSTIADLYRWNYTNLKDLKLSDEFILHNAGFVHEFQVVNVADYNGVGESCPRPHFIQNLGEAEYVVATYMYMRLLG